MYTVESLYTVEISKFLEPWGAHDLRNTTRPFVSKSLSKEARIALKRKKKQAKKSRKLNR